MGKTDRLFWLVLLFALQPVFGQVSVTDTLWVEKGLQFRLKPFIQKETFQLSLGQAVLDSTWYELNLKTGWLKLVKKPTSNQGQPLIARYHAFPLDIPILYFRYLPPAFKPDTTLLRDVTAYRSPVPRSNNPFEGSPLQRNGSITRGIVAGNRRDVTIESGFKMQLNGEIAPGVQLNASLTDENAPIQPEGTTQRISDVDRIVIALKSRYGLLNLGDFDLSMTRADFARINRKLQGLSAQVNYSPSTGILGEQYVQLAAATSRGIYHSLSFSGQEGVQGPYRLYGKQGESFIIVIAGSERVFLDGKILERGSTLDYIIDYAAGEIMFTSKILMTSVKRVVVEFEYTTNRFSRSLVGAGAESGFLKDRHAPTGRVKIGIHALREADAVSFTEELNVSELELEVLKNAGDDPAAAAVSGASLVPYDPLAGYTFYVKRDTVVAGVVLPFFSVLKTLEEAGEVYRVRFTSVEQGKGDYIRVGEATNGLTYRFVGPGKGNYVSMRLLPRPQEKALVAVRGQIMVVPGLTMMAEWAQSKQDLNRLSQINDEDNSSQAAQFGVRLKPLKLAKWAISGQGHYRYTGATFEAFDRIQRVEFARYWNLGESTGGIGSGFKDFAENNQEVEVGIDYGAHHRLALSAGSIHFSDIFRAGRVSGHIHMAQPGLPDVVYMIEQINSQMLQNGLSVDSGWLRQKGLVKMSPRKSSLTPSIAFEGEHKTLITEAFLQKGSFSFYDLQPAIGFGNKRLSGTIGMEIRHEKKVFEASMLPEHKALTGKASAQFNPVNWLSGETILGFRQKKYSEWAKAAESSQNASSLLLKGNIRVSPFKRAFEVQGFYEANTEKSPILQEIFREVLPGQGAYVWTDVNKDGLRQVDEFLPAVSEIEGNYTRLLVPSDELKPVANVEARLRLVLVPQRILVAQNHWLYRLVRAIETQSVADMVEKTEETDLGRVYRLAPAVLRNPDKTINGRLRFSQDVHFWRNHPTFGGTLQFLKMSGLSRLAAGLENRIQERWNAEARYSPHKNWKFRITGTIEQNRQESKTFVSRNYDIRSRIWHMETQFQPYPTQLLTIGFTNASKSDQFSDTPKNAAILRFPLAIRLAKAGKLQWNGQIEFSNIRLNGSAEGLAGYELTDGRGAGRNWLWGSSLQYNVSRLLRASVYYDGRTASDAPTLHNVRAQINATF